MTMSKKNSLHTHFHMTCSFSDKSLRNMALHRKKIIYLPKTLLNIYFNVMMSINKPVMA